MRTLFAILFFFFGIQVFGQKKLDSLFVIGNFPKRISATIKNESGKIPDFPSNYTSIVTFKSVNTSVYYYIFVYRSADSEAFKIAESKHWMSSGCNIVLNKDSENNFKSFIKDGYYFLLQRCSCKTGKNKKCAGLARRLNQWIRE